MLTNEIEQNLADISKKYIVEIDERRCEDNSWELARYVALDYPNIHIRRYPPDTYKFVFINNKLRLNRDIKCQFKVSEEKQSILFEVFVEESNYVYNKVEMINLENEGMPKIYITDYVEDGMMTLYLNKMYIKGKCLQVVRECFNIFKHIIED